MKCINCAGEIPALSLHCVYCGHEVPNNAKQEESIDHIKELQQRLVEADGAISAKDKMLYGEMQVWNNKANIIMAFTMPTTKQDLLNFFLFAYGNYEGSKGGIRLGGDPINKAWLGKAKQAYGALRVYGAGDAIVQNTLKQYSFLDVMNTNEKKGCMPVLMLLAFAFIISTFLLSSCGGRDCSKSPGVYQRGYERGKLNRLIGYRADHDEIEVEYGRGISRDFMPCLVEGYNEGYSGKESRYPEAQTTVSSSSSSKVESSYNPYTYTPEPEPEKAKAQPVENSSVNDMMEEQIEKSCIITGRNVNVRSAPEKLSDVIYRLDKGESVKLDKAFKPKSDVVNGIEGNWRMIQYGEHGLGWVFDTFLQCE